MGCAHTTGFHWLRPAHRMRPSHAPWPPHGLWPHNLGCGHRMHCGHPRAMADAQAMATAWAAATPLDCATRCGDPTVCSHPMRCGRPLGFGHHTGCVPLRPLHGLWPPHRPRRHCMSCDGPMDSGRSMSPCQEEQRKPARRLVHDRTESLSLWLRTGRSRPTDAAPLRYPCQARIHGSPNTMGARLSSASGRSVGRSTGRSVCWSASSSLRCSALLLSPFSVHSRILVNVYLNAILILIFTLYLPVSPTHSSSCSS